MAAVGQQRLPTDPRTKARSWAFKAAAAQQSAMEVGHGKIIQCPTRIGFSYGLAGQIEGLGRV